MHQPLAERLGFVLHDVARLMRRYFDQRVRDLGLTQAQWRAMLHLSHAPGLSQAALSEVLDVQPITLTRLIDRMESAGWVERRPNPSDRRAVRLYLTPKVKPLLSALQSRAAETLEHALAGVSAADCEQLIETLLTIKENLASEPEEDRALEDAGALHAKARA